MYTSPISQFSRSVVSNSLWPHRLQHPRAPCPSPTPRASSNSCPLSQWCHPTISSCHLLLLLPSIFPSIRVFSNELVLLIRWPKYWSFSMSHSNEYSGLISIRIDLAVQGTVKSFLQKKKKKEFSPTPQFKSINSHICLWSEVKWSHSVMSNSLRHHGL